MAKKDLVDGEADLSDGEDDESINGYGSEDGRPRRQSGGLDDSSDEEDDDDEEEVRRVREGFIVEDDDDEDNDEDETDDDAELASDGELRQDHKRKRELRVRDEDEQLDEEDLELIEEQHGSWDSRKDGVEPSWKRLKQGHGELDTGRSERRGLDEIFDDDVEDGADSRRHGRSHFRGQQDELDDFIEEDYPDDATELQKILEDHEVSRPRDKAALGAIDARGLDKDALEDMEAIFSNAEDYDWALQMEDEGDQERDDQTIELKDVFEPSQLREKMLTDEDNEIRYTDEPERFQLERRPFKHLQLTDDQFKEESRWIAEFMFPPKRFPPDLQVPFIKAVGKVLEFFVVDDREVPYVFHHRKDYLTHSRKPRNARNGGDASAEPVESEKLLTQEDLWRILELDIKFRSLVDRRNALEKTYDNLKTAVGVQDHMLESLIPMAKETEELQDLQDYLQFQYSAEFKDLAAMSAPSVQGRRPGSKSAHLERIRASKVYRFVKAYGISADQLTNNALREGPKDIPEDDAQYPTDFADSLTDENFPTGDSVMTAARQMYADELLINPRMRKHLRRHFYQAGLISCHRTDKGLRKIDESHPFYEVKYLINQTMNDLARKPELFLKMMKAEEEDLIEVHISLQNEKDFRRQLYEDFDSENVSERAELWRAERRKVLDLWFPRAAKLISRGVREHLRTACQDEVLKVCREEYFRKLDQRPFKPKGLEVGDIPRVLVVSNGMGDPARDPVGWAWVEEEGHVLEHGRFTNLGKDEGQRTEFAELVSRLEPDAIGVSGWCAATSKLVRDLESVIDEKRLVGPLSAPSSDNLDAGGAAAALAGAAAPLLEVVVVCDEVARLYKDSARAKAELPGLDPVTRYCVGLARYMQSPLKEYAALGKDVGSLALHSCQHLLPHAKLMKHLESAMVDMVNLCGVDINEAVNDPYTANLLPYVAGLGPRKASSVLKAINKNGGMVNSRDELVGDPEKSKLPVVGPVVFQNCASFLYIEYDPSGPESDPLDNTRVHPEDYELARKMSEDAMDLDEEDVKAETDENGPGAIVRKLFRQNEQDKVNELVLEDYADRLERKYYQRKRATLENIRAELQQPYEELRNRFATLSATEIFTMFTGETGETLCREMVVAVNVRVVKDDYAIVRLDCGVEGRVEVHDADTTSKGSLREVFQVGQTVRAKVIEVNHQDFTVRLRTREDALRQPSRRPVDRDAASNEATWDEAQERRDQDELREKDQATGRAQRVVNHPLFRSFGATQAEEYLGSQPAGEVVIRPSSLGNDHLAVTWKVADGVYQHIDVLELQKETEFSIGRTLRVGGKFTYSDLDELIVNHVQAMARKVEELMRHDKFQQRSKSELEKWLTTYVDANPTRSAYAFCLQPKNAGYFLVLFKINRAAAVHAWPIKVVPRGYEMLGSQYPDTRALCNGFKLRYQSEITKLQQRR